MRRHSCLLVGCALVLAGAGCGTFNNVVGDGDHLPYGGVRKDGELLRECSSGASDHAKNNADQGVLPLVYNTAAFTAFMDMPLSFVGDTLTLPYTLCCLMAQGEAPAPEQTVTTSTRR